MSRYWNDIPEDTLSHHGILGMKWGVRRFQNADGTLTERGKRKAARTERSKVKSAAATFYAKSGLKSDYKLNSIYAYTSNTRAKGLNKKAKKLATKANDEKELGNLAKSERLKNKSDKVRKRAANFAKYGKMYADKVATSKKLYDDISKGEMKAGRDFINQTDFDIYPMVFTTLIAGEQRIIPVKK